MDAVKFIEERRRMYTLGCIKHAINDYNTKAEAVVAEVEQWSKEHPRKTRQSVFLEHYPDAKIDDDGVIAICPTAFSSAYRDDIGKCAWVTCSKCRSEFWSQKVE